jgi:hypothetical protein
VRLLRAAASPASWKSALPLRSLPPISEGANAPDAFTKNEVTI